MQDAESDGNPAGARSLSFSLASETNWSERSAKRQAPGNKFVKITSNKS